jgi:hypothetical protein
MAELSLAAEPQVNNGSIATLKLKVTSSNKNVVPQLYLKLDLPAGVKLISTEPAQIGGAWGISGLQSPANQEFIAKIQVTGQPGTVVRVGAHLAGTLFQEAVPQLSRMTEIMVTAASGAEVVENETSIQPTFGSEIRYYSASGIQFGYGPWPPRVGQETVVRMFWYVRPGDVTTTNGVVTMILPSQVRWVGHQSITGGSQLKYEASSRKVTWVIGALSGQTPAILASFDIGFTPKTADRGHYVTVAKTAYFSFRTENSGQRQLTSPALKTSEIDPNSAQRGLVR